MPNLLRTLADYTSKLIKPSPPLLSILKAAIRQQGPLTLERYMELVLQHPKHGYYRHGNPIGSKGDFHTAPEVSQMFGEMIGVWCVHSWQAMGKPDPFVLLELGPGRGTLLDDLLRFTQPLADFHAALRLRLLESNTTLRTLQQETLVKFHPTHIEDLAQLDPLPTLVIANEFFDNLPLRQFVKRKQDWFERRVDFKRGKLLVVDVEIPSASLPDRLADTAKDGWVYEVSDQSRRIMRQLAAHIARFKGAALIADYGYDSPSGEGTLDAWSRLKPTNILASPGKTDVTADVDFSALRQIVQEQASLASEIMDQGDFLQKQGIVHRALALRNQLPEDRREEIDTALHQLISPSKMGALWKVMIFHARA
ncbi:MAG: SAM-dependent methyltransferase [Alphaproteobacteria bacterium]|nr:SAM-dependent methyltransferase [Alphaproteobacteria bacterium]